MGFSWLPKMFRCFFFALPSSSSHMIASTCRRLAFWHFGCDGRYAISLRKCRMSRVVA